jgi:hypothetical protein
LLRLETPRRLGIRVEFEPIPAKEGENREE